VSFDDLEEEANLFQEYLEKSSLVDLKFLELEECDEYLEEIDRIMFEE
jgi:hypothetical protein